jgi:hypothetical protein
MVCPLDRPGGERHTAAYDCQALKRLGDPRSLKSPGLLHERVTFDWAAWAAPPVKGHLDLPLGGQVCSLLADS